ncbi:hypothetical protein HanHA300_Chr09g0313761 [Helianthus annuus]|nr:hypothetical protein HanHA300_Chr09g0313761 [Helianthus annuus]KAJ0711061.1 hypothetical protein HanOQP8_Chr09g0319591 [Helianthus annuus]
MTANKLHAVWCRIRIWNYQNSIHHRCEVHMTIGNIKREIIGQSGYMKTSVVYVKTEIETQKL